MEVWKQSIPNIDAVGSIHAVARGAGRAFAERIGLVTAEVEEADVVFCDVPWKAAYREKPPD